MSLWLPMEQIVVSRSIHLFPLLSPSVLFQYRYSCVLDVICCQILCYRLCHNYSNPQKERGRFNWARLVQLNGQDIYLIWQNMIGQTTDESMNYVWPHHVVTCHSYDMESMLHFRCSAKNQCRSVSPLKGLLTKLDLAKY